MQSLWSLGTSYPGTSLYGFCDMTSKAVFKHACITPQYGIVVSTLLFANIARLLVP